MDFVFFNCCELGYAEPKSVGSYLFGFAQGAITTGLSKEVICNRWGVDAQNAMRLADEFYRTRPRTPAARVDALFRARRLVQSVSEVNDLSWLAPIHLRVNNGV